jgi:DNA polymerase III subunit gamma/tau
LEQLNGFKTELLSFLRKQLQNYELDIEAIVSVEEDKKIVYTSSDKFNYLAKKNPALLELKQKLGLDIDY